MITRAELERDLVIVACAVSAGIHAALTPEHLSERTAAGAGFGASVVLLAAIAVALTRDGGAWPLAGAAAVLAGLLVSYALAVTTGFPVLHPEPEPVDGLALFTKVVELVGLLAATDVLVHARGRFRSLVIPRTKGTPA